VDVCICVYIYICVCICIFVFFCVCLYECGGGGREWWYEGNNDTLNFKVVSHHQITNLRKYDAIKRVFRGVNILQLLGIFVFSLKLLSWPIFIPCCITYWQRTGVTWSPCVRGIHFQKRVTDVSNTFTQVRTDVSTSVTWMKMFPILK